MSARQQTPIPLALSHNMPEGLKTIVANCLAHGRRRFVEVAMNFPEECLYVLDILKDVYTNDAEAKDRGLSPELQKHAGEPSSEPDSWMPWNYRDMLQRTNAP